TRTGERKVSSRVGNLTLGTRGSALAAGLFHLRGLVLTEFRKLVPTSSWGKFVHSLSSSKRHANCDPRPICWPLAGGRVPVACGLTSSQSRHSNVAARQCRRLDSRPGGRKAPGTAPRGRAGLGCGLRSRRFRRRRARPLSG